MNQQLDKLKNTLLTASRVLEESMENYSLLRYFINSDVLIVLHKNANSTKKFVDAMFALDRGDTSLNILLEETKTAIKEDENHSLMVLKMFIETLKEKNEQGMTELIGEL